MNSTNDIPVIEFPAELPVVEKREEIAEAIRQHQVIIVAGETGSGKTTQLPKICLQLGRGQKGQIGHTQPRRLAARTVANRIAHELHEELGETVGYQVRFTDKVSKATRVKLMTDGILLAEIQRDRRLQRYDTIILDEAHERSLNIDFLLGYLKQLLPQRPDLKLIITSATIDVASFSAHFDDAPVIEVSGRSFAIETHYLEPGAEDESGAEPVVAAVEAVMAREYGAPGDMLVFLSGEREIRELAKQLRHRGVPNLEVLPLYARLSQAEQNRVFESKSRRGVRVVLATNVAETSLTVPGIRYVIDTGFARLSRYSYRTKVQRLPIEPVSQASANQRQGRCGRVAEGVCLRLYSEQDFLGRSEFTAPEIQRTNLAAVILRMLRLRLGEVSSFPFINPPDHRLVRDGYKLLDELGALDNKGQLNAIGKRMADLPVDPRLARMLIAAQELECLTEVLVITSALSVQDPRERPTEKQQAADEQHRRFWDEKSDFLAWVNLWNYYEQQRQELSQNQLRKLCKKEYLAFMRMREWREIHFQLTLACRQAGFQQNKTPASFESVHRALMGGLLSNLAQFKENRDYLGSRNRLLQVFPGSSQSKSKPRWIMSAEIVETSRVFARCVAQVDPEWALDINPALLKHHYYEPHWQARSGRAMAFERISLYGLVLVDKRRVHYGPIEPVESRELLIRTGLIAGRVRQPPAFLRHNLRLVEELEALESRFRRRDLVADETVLYRFYDELLPANITTLSRLKSWLKKNEGADASLRLQRQQLLVREVDEELGNQFPDTLSWEDLELPLSYHFEPGHVDDGVSVSVPLGLLNRVPRYRFEWLVPGLLKEKCVQLVKGLPKSIRKNLVPVPDQVSRALVDVEPQDRPLTEVLAQRLRETTAQRIAMSDWQPDKLDDYYRMNFRIVDAEGKLLRQSRDLPELVESFREQTRDSLRGSEDDGPSETGLTAWTCGDLPSIWRTQQAGVSIESYPALVDKGECVDLELLDYPRQAAIAHRNGLIRLYRLQCSQQVRYFRKQYLRGNEANLVLAGCGMERPALIDDLTAAAFALAIADVSEAPRTKTEFDAMLQQGRGQLVGCGNDIESLLLDCLTTLTKVRRGLLALKDKHSQSSKEDMQVQLDGLFYPGFVSSTPYEWLQQYPRYTKALLLRLERLSGQQNKDQQHTQSLAEMAEPMRLYLHEQADALQLNPQLQRYRWLLEELRVSFFAQSLGTSTPVSAKRLKEQWDRVEQWKIENPA